MYALEEPYSGTGLRERGWSGGLQDVGADARDELLEQLGQAERCRAHFADAVVSSPSDVAHVTKNTCVTKHLHSPAERQYGISVRVGHHTLW